jgi:tripartite-type tricarboxylate transporter receptor subunit TctC
MARILLFTALAIASLIPAATHAQSYPVRPLRLIVPSAPGGSPDIHSRLMANELGKQLNQQVIVDNRPGASQIIGFELMARAPSDGYTVGYATFLVATNPSMFAKLPYDFARDFQPVMHQIAVPNILAVSPSLGIASVQDLIRHARANPDKLSYGISAFGASNHLSIELFKMMTDTRLVLVSYKAIQQAISEAIGGQIHVVCDNMGSILPHVRAGRMRGLGVTSPQRAPAAPELPALAESGLPGYEIMPWSGYVVPTRTSRDIVMRLNAELNKALFAPAVAEKMSAMGSIAIGGSPEQFAEHVRKETAKWAHVIKTAGIRAN